jgi:hypothetical protein
MFKATKRTLSAVAVIAAVSSPAAAYARIEGGPNPLSRSSTRATTRPGTSSTASLRQLEQAQLGSYRQAVAKLIANTPGGLSGPVAASSSSVSQNRSSSAASVRSTHPSASSVSSAGSSSQEGFQWGDAGIGAAGMLLLVSAGAATVSRRRSSHATIS